MCFQMGIWFLVINLDQKNTTSRQSWKCVRRFKCGLKGENSKTYFTPSPPAPPSAPLLNIIEFNSTDWKSGPGSLLGACNKNKN